MNLDQLKEEGMRKQSRITKIVWPDGTEQDKLDSHVAGMTWQHHHRGHDQVYKDCYACVCADAY